MSTLPTAPASTASWAAAVCSEGEPVQRQAGVRSHLQGAVRSRRDDVRDCRILDRGRHRVDEHELVANVAPHQVSDRDAKLTATVSGIAGDGAVRRQHGGVKRGVRPRRDLDNHIDAAGGDAKDLVGSAGVR
jgi:hypothetical protein